MKKLIVFACLILVSTMSMAHSYYVSIATMEYNAQTLTVDVSLKLTAHDFEHILEDKFQQRIHIENVADTSEIGKFYIDYLKTNFILSSGENQCPMKYFGKEVTLRDELFFYLSFENITNPKSIHIKNTLLFTLFTQQQNIVHYKFGEITKSVTLVNAKPEESISID